MRYSILAPLAAASIALLAACTDSGAPTAPATAGPHALTVASCPTTSPVQQINTLINFITQQTAIPAAVRTQIITQLRSVIALLVEHRPAAAITQLRALITRIQASSFPAPLAVKQALVARINCIIAALTR